MKKFLITLATVLLPIFLAAQLYKDPTATVENRVRDLISRMTPEEKFWQLFMIPGDLSIGRGQPPFRNPSHWPHRLIYR